MKWEGVVTEYHKAFYRIGSPNRSLYTIQSAETDSREFDAGV
jgi:hypothetical protein